MVGRCFFRGGLPGWRAARTGSAAGGAGWRCDAGALRIRDVAFGELQGGVSGFGGVAGAGDCVFQFTATDARLSLFDIDADRAGTFSAGKATRGVAAAGLVL